MVAYRRFLTEVRQELGQIQKEYNIEILRRQNDAENLALHRSLEWFKQECSSASPGIKLSNEVKKKSMQIDSLKSQLEEMHVYKRGYEKGIKTIKKDLLVLKFVNKTKTNLLRKYTEKLQDANKFIDAADLRPQLTLYLNNAFGKVSDAPSDSIYLKNQLRLLAEQPNLLNTADICEFFVKTLRRRDREYQHELKKKDEAVKLLQTRLGALGRSVEQHRANVSNMPGLLNAIMEDFILQTDKEQSQERSINRGVSRPASTQTEVLITAHAQHELSPEERFFVADFSTEVYSRMDDEQKREFIFTLMNNKAILFAFREFLLLKLDPHDFSRLDTVPDNRIRLKISGFGKSKDSLKSSQRSRTSDIAPKGRPNNRAASDHSKSMDKANRQDAAYLPRVTRNESFSFAGPHSREHGDTSRSGLGSRHEKQEREAIHGIAAGASNKRHLLRSILKKTGPAPT